MLALVNPRSGGGRGALRWARIEDALLARYPGLDVTCSAAEAVPDLVARALESGESWFLAAGGDGTVNLVASELIRHGCAGTLGAIGLGSSNDYHKPVLQRFFGLPSRLDFAHAEPRDVCRLETVDESGDRRIRHFLLNASAGITAAANWHFNNPGRVLGLLKQVSTDAAIMAAALHGIFASRSQRVALTLDGETRDVSFRNLGIVKSGHFAGALRYDSPFEARSRTMYAHRIGPVGMCRLLRILFDLSRGRFTGLAGTESRRASRIALSADAPFALECDGEVTRAVAAEFSISAERLWCAA